MTTNLFVIANVKQLRTDGSFRILLPCFRTSWGVGVLNSAIFTIGLTSARLWRAFGISRQSIKAVCMHFIHSPFELIQIVQGKFLQICVVLANDVA